MQYVEISPGMKFSRIVQGFWRLTGGLPGDWGMSTTDLVDLLGKRFELGVTTLDSADVYGRGSCEIEMGKALREFKRDAYQIVTKAGIRLNFQTRFFYYDTTYEWITAKCRESIEKLGCGYIDLFLIHREDPMIDHYEVARAFADLKKEGLIKEAGVSNFDPFKFNALNKVMGGSLRTNQIELHPACFEHFNSGMMDVLQSEKIHPMIWSPLAGGKIATDESEPFKQIRAVCSELAKKYSVSLNTIVYAWILNHPVGALPLVGSSKMERLKEAIDALSLNLDREDWYRIYTASGQQKIK
jgi:predicted oxidoreductase